MTADSYYKNLSVDSAYNQLELFKTLPTILSDGDELKVPAFQDSIVFDSNKNLNGKIFVKDYSGKTSVRELSVVIFRSKFSDITVNALIDGRIRR